MRRLVFATNNLHKLDEAKKILQGSIEILSLADIDCTDEIPETANTLQGNAMQKAQYIKEKFGFDCFADDTGLLIEALDNRPGVYSARYAGEPSNSFNNMQKVLTEMQGVTNREAKFMTCVALIEGDSELIFNGEIKGEITTAPIGENGFGYDPIFTPENHNETFAQLPEDIKNSISHRARAMQKFATYLNNK